MAVTFSYGMSSSSSAPQLTWRSGRGGTGLPPSKQGSQELPMLVGSVKQPLSFEDLYKHARRRLQRKAADLRQGGQPTPTHLEKAQPPAITPAAMQQDFLGATLGGPKNRKLHGSVLQPMQGSEPPDAEDDENDRDWMEGVLNPKPQPEPVQQQTFKRRQTSKRGTVLGMSNQLKLDFRMTGGNTNLNSSRSPSRTPRMDTLSEAPSKQRSRMGSRELETNLHESLESPGEQARMSIMSMDPDEYPEHWKAAFNRFKAVGEREAHLDEMSELLRFLGHGLTLPEHYEPIMHEITQYDYFDFEEFYTFMVKYQYWERNKMKEVFEEYDTDCSGEISILELRPLMTSMGLVPHTATIREALQEVDDGNATLGFEELIRFLGAYSAKQGFSASEAKEMRMHFDRFAISSTSMPLADKTAAEADRVDSPTQRPPGESILALPDVENVLTLCCGPQQAQFAPGVVERFMRNPVKQQGSKSMEGLTFAEFLIVARMIRESQREKLRKEHPDMVERMQSMADSGSPRRAAGKPGSPSYFSRPGSRPKSRDLVAEDRALSKPDAGVFEDADGDGNGSVSVMELKEVLKSQGYTALKQVISEICTELVEDWDPTYELDFNEFFDFLMIFHQREGFLKAEVEAFKRCFNDHDEDASGEISTNELGKLLRYLGYRNTTADVHSYVIQADNNQSGQLDWREFLRLMRRFKENACEEAGQVFKTLCKRVRTNRGMEEEVMEKKNLREALRKLGHGAPPRNPLLEAFTVFRLDDFIGILDATRCEFVEKERGKAGFTEEELKYFHDIFDRHDRNRTGSIGVLEMEQVLNMFGWGPTDKQEQTALVAKMQTARERARKAGGQDSDNGETSFWVFVQLLRLLHDEQDRKETEELQALCVELSFSEVEVDQFHQIFRQYARPNPDFITGLQRNMAPYLLPGESARKLIRTLGVQIGRDVDVLKNKLASLDKKGRTDYPVLEFWPFLRLMRWLLDTNFKGINDSVTRFLKQRASGGEDGA